MSGNDKRWRTVAEAAVAAAEAEVEAADAETVGNDGKQVVMAVSRRQQR
jgi:hypothetical protein